MDKLAILHYMPLEYYPPVTNLLDYLSERKKRSFKRVKVFTTTNIKERVEYKNEEDSTSIKRSYFPKVNDNAITRLIKYFHYNFFTLLNLIFYRPNVLLYYESYSAWPAFIYTKYLNRKCKLFIHFHEYSSLAWYKTTMRQVKYFHKLEKKWLFKHALWISQTNPDRLDFFYNDHQYLNKDRLYVMPNYPPSSWKEVKGNSPDKGKSSTVPPIKMVYVGSLSFKDTYIREVCKWVDHSNQNIQLDIFSYNLHRDVRNYFEKLSSSKINFHPGGIEYNHQPELLSKYDIGLILYKAHDINYTYNAPNKLFEYLACDLDVWYPNELKGPSPYQTKNSYPKVIPVDFSALDKLSVEKVINHENLEYKPSIYFCEKVYKKLVDDMLKCPTAGS